MKTSRFRTIRVVHNIDKNFILLLAMYKTYISFLELLEDYLLRTWLDHRRLTNWKNLIEGTVLEINQSYNTMMKL